MMRGVPTVAAVIVLLSVCCARTRAGVAVAAPGEEVDCSFQGTLPPQYIAYKASSPPVFDGKVDGDPFWDEVPWTDNFVDISVGKSGPPPPTPRFHSKAKIRYDDDYLYVAGWMEEPQVWATLKEHDTVIFNDNDFEVFVNTDGTTHFYKEYEMNAFNTNWDLCLNRPYLNGGYENSSRVLPTHGFDMMPLLKSAAHVDGAINDPLKGSKSWSVEVRFPIGPLSLNETNRVPPRRGDYWRVNFSRVQYRVTVDTKTNTYVKVPNLEPDNWVWAPIGLVDIHLPEKWGYVQFSDLPPGTDRTVVDPEWPARALAMQLYYALTAYQAAHGVFTDDIEDLAALTPIAGALGCGDVVTVRLKAAGGAGFLASVRPAGAAGRYVGQVDETRFLTVLDLGGGGAAAP